MDHKDTNRNGSKRPARKARPANNHTQRSTRRSTQGSKGTAKKTTHSSRGPARSQNQRTDGVSGGGKRTHARKGGASPQRSQHSRKNNKQTNGKPRRRSNVRNMRAKSAGAVPMKMSRSSNVKEDKIPPLGADTIRVIPIGGVEEIGKNMTAIEIGNDIIIVDCGFQFREDYTPGIDYILPNTKYLEDRKDKVRAILVTHGHLDHIGGIPFVIESLGYPPIYSRRLTNVMIKKRQDEFPHLEPLDIREIESDRGIKIGDLTVKFFSVNHTIPDSMGIIIETPYGSIVHTGDLKIDHKDGVPSEAEEKEWAKVEKEDVLLLMGDSTNVEKPGWSFPEETVHENMEKIIKEVSGRLIIGTFASQLERIIKILEIAEKYKKKVVIEGRSMKNNVEIVKQLKMLNVHKDVFIPMDEIDNYPDNRIMILATGAQGDEFAALMRIAKKTHKKFRVKKSDTIVLSSSVIPGNERPVQTLKDNLSRQGAHIIHYQIAGVHSSGHANHDETLWIHKKVKPKFFIPLHGYHYMLQVHAAIAREAGMPEKNAVIADNGSIVEIRGGGEKIIKLKEEAPNSLRLVDGFSIGDMQDVLIRDRKMLSQDGMFVVVATINTKTGRLHKSPDIISRGFVYLRESQELLQQSRLIIKRTVERSTKNMHPINFDDVKNEVSDDVQRFLFQKTNKHPIVIPVILGV